jgi:acyl-CoA reductase-like NAD-dependent aldehyde dehydrogenase
MLRSRYAPNIPGYAPQNSDVLEVRSPFSGDVVAEIELVDSNGMERALDAATEAFRRRPRGLPAPERAAILKSLAGLMRHSHEDLSLLIAREGGKPLLDARVEVTRAINTVEISAEEVSRIQGVEIPMSGTPAALGRLAFTVREPIGVVAAVSAFNHPVNLIAHQVAPAVAAGCPVLVKPAPDTAVSCMVIMELLRGAGLPPELGMAVPSTNEVAEQLVSSDRIGFFNFIGSARVGWFLRSKLAPGVRCTLEHGGAAPVILDESADLERALPALLKGGYYHAGQVCVSVQRVFAHASIKDDVIGQLTEGAAALVVGDPTSPKTEVGPLIRQAEVDRVGEWVEEARTATATVTVGGNAMGHQCYAPTVITDAPRSAKVMKEEVFGPVVVVNDFEKLDEAINRANDVRWSFQAAIFTQDIDRALLAAQRLKGAAVMINDHSAFRVDWMPFAGRGPSGLGVGGVAYTIKDLTEEKMIVVKIDEGAGKER